MARIGLIPDPCGVPASTAFHWPLSRTPASSHRSIKRSTRGSAILCASIRSVGKPDALIGHVRKQTGERSAGNPHAAFDGPLRRRHVFALAHQSIGKEADNIEENEFIGEDAGPPDYGLVQHDRLTLANAVFDIQKRYGISDRKLLEEAKVSHHTLDGLREGRRIADAFLMKLFRAAEALRQEADPIGAALDKALQELRRLRDKVGGRNKLAKVLGVSAPYLRRALVGDALKASSYFFWSRALRAAPRMSPSEMPSWPSRSVRRRGRGAATSPRGEQTIG